jgi:glycosyltransferase involved in cell wall biosynthesis
MMKVAFVTSGYPPVSPGGAGVSSQLIVRQLRARGVTVHVYGIIGENRELCRAGSGTWHLPKGELYPGPKTIGENLSAYRHLPRLDTYDLVHVYNVRHIPACVLRSDSPVVATFNNHMWVCIDAVQHLREGTPECGLRRDLRYAGTEGYTGLARIGRVAVHYVGRHFARQVDAATVQTGGMKRVMETCGYDVDDITVVPNLVDPAFEGEPKNGNTVLFVGRLREEKGPQMVVRAFASLPEEIKREWKLELVGDGPLREEVERAVRTLEIPEATVGYRPYSELPDVYRSAGLLVHASRFTEPFSRCWLEAMASGTPILCSRNPGSSSVLSGVAEFYDPFDVEDLTAGLERCLRSPSRREAMATRGSERVGRYDAETVVGGYVDVYRNTIE